MIQMRRLKHSLQESYRHTKVSSHVGAWGLLGAFANAAELNNIQKTLAVINASFAIDIAYVMFGGSFCNREFLADVRNATTLC